MQKEFYTIFEAAQISGLEEKEVREAISQGILPAEISQNIGDFIIKRKDLIPFIKARKQLKLTTEIFTKKRVLIIDDEINFANLLKLELERDIRFEAKAAGHGRDGLVLARDFSPHLILLDFMLPDITGDKFLEELQKLRKEKEIKVIVYSAHTAQIIKQIPNLAGRLQELGADEFVSKSAGTRELLAKVYQYLGMDIKTRIVKR
jgi:CheY-like chemotaxis protein